MTDALHRPDTGISASRSPGSAPRARNTPNSRTIPMFQPYSGSLTPSITAFFYTNYASGVPAADATCTITHDTTITVTYITA